MDGWATMGVPGDMGVEVVGVGVVTEGWVAH